MYPKKPLPIIGIESLSLTQRCIRWMYLKYVVMPEREVHLAIYPSKIEMAMIEKELYELDGRVH
jgi:hypothetical protein